jgi:tetratricopeptide (TPR) repeat protein
VRGAIFALALILPFGTAALDTPKQIAEFQLNAPVVAALARNGLVVALTRGSEGSSSMTLHILALGSSGELVKQGVFTIEAVQGKTVALGVSPDGQSAAFVSWDMKYRADSDFRLRLIDISRPERSRDRWRSIFKGRSLLLSPNADFLVAATGRSDESPHWEGLVYELTPSGEKLLHRFRGSEYLEPALMASENGRFLVDAFPMDMTAYDVRDRSARQTNPSSSMNRFACVPLVTDEGYALVEDDRLPRLGLYRLQGDIPRTAQLAHGGIRFCEYLGRVGMEYFVAAPEQGRIKSLKLEPAKLEKTGEWYLPQGVQALGIAAPRRLLAARDDTLLVFDLSTASLPAVNWLQLKAAHEIAMSNYKSKDYVRKATAEEILQKAGMRNAVHTPLTDITAVQAAAIFNDYAFLMRYGEDRGQEAIEALRRSIALDPARRIAYLNLAELLRGNMVFAVDWSEQQSRADEIRGLYQAYVRLGGKPTAAIENFLDDGPLSRAPLTCQSMIDKHDAGWPGPDNGRHFARGPDGRRLELFVDEQGSARYAYVDAFEASADRLVEFPLEEDMRFWRGDDVSVIGWEDGTFILHSRSGYLVRAWQVEGEDKCTFRTEVRETLGPKTREPGLCRMLTTDAAPLAIGFEEEVPIEHETIRKRHVLSHQRNAGQVDFDNDGKTERLLRLELSSGAGTGCEAIFYDRLAADGAGFAPPSSLLQRLQDFAPQEHYPLKCGSTSRFFRYKGRTYFERRPYHWPPNTSEDEYHIVRRIENGRVLEVCDFKFSTKTVAAPLPAPEP